MDQAWLDGPGAYWFWSRIPTAAEIDRQVDELAAAGYQTFLIQARLSMPLDDYLSPNYLRAYRRAVDAAARRGLTVGIYDDYNWMSGHAGGRTVRARPDLRERHLFWTAGNISGGRCELGISAIRSLMYDGWSEPAMAWAYAGGRPRWDEWRLEAALAPAGAAEQLEDVAALVRLEPGAEGCAARLEGAPAALEGRRVVLFLSARCATSRMPNYLHPQAMETFVQVGLQPYARALGERLGTTVRFVFFDHPYCGFYDWAERTGAVGSSLMWTADLPQRFAAERGYPLDQALLALVEPGGAEMARRRCDFFETYGALGRERTFGPLRRWAQAHCLLQTGHELLGFTGAWGANDGFPYLDVRTNFAADYFAIGAYKDLAAVDASGYQPQISAAFGASVARACGQPAPLIEQYTVCPAPDADGAAGDWNLSLETLRRQALRFLVHGAGHHITHAFYLDDGLPDPVTPLANLRYDFPPGVNYEPWFTFHPAFAAEWRDLAGLVRAAAAPAAPERRVALLYPLRTYWVDGPKADFSRQMAAWVQALTNAGLGWDVIDELQLEQGALAGGALRWLASEYPWLVLPGVRVVRSRRTLLRLWAFLEAGGQVAASGSAIDASQETGRLSHEDAELARSITRHPGYHALPDAAAFARAAWAADLLDSPGAPRLASAGDGPANGRVWLRAVPDGAAWLALLLNTADKPVRAAVAWPAEGALDKRLPGSGAWRPTAWARAEGGRTTLWADLCPGEMRVLRLDPTRPPARPALVECSHPVLGAEPTAGKLRLEAQGTHNPRLRWRTTSGMGAADVPCARPVEGAWTLAVDGAVIEGLASLDYSWEELGLDGYAGPGAYQTELPLAPADAGRDWVLTCPTYDGPLAVLVNGDLAGQTLCGRRGVRIAEKHLRAGPNDLELRTANSAGGRYYGGTPLARLARGGSGRLGLVSLAPVITLEL